MKHYYIKKVFDNWDKLKTDGIWFSGIRGEGEFKSWYETGKMYKHCFYKNSKLEGEFKRWHENGEFFIHCLFKDGEVIKDYLK